MCCSLAVQQGAPHFLEGLRQGLLKAYGAQSFSTTCIHVIQTVTGINRTQRPAEYAPEDLHVVQEIAFQKSMSMNMSTPLIGNPDRDFAVEMISHHQVNALA